MRARSDRRGGWLGVDVSAPLLERAEARRDELAAANVSFRRGDAQIERFEAASFDLAASRFGLMFFADPVAAFGNIATALRPGGRLVFVAWQGPEANPWFTLPQQAAERRLGLAKSGPPDAPGPMAFRDAPRVVDLLQRAGFVECRAVPQPAELHLPGGLDAAVALAQHVGPISRMLREKGGTEEDRAAIAADLREAFAGFVREDGIRVPAAVTIFTGSRP